MNTTINTVSSHTLSIFDLIKHYAQQRDLSAVSALCVAAERTLADQHVLDRWASVREVLLVADVDSEDLTDEVCMMLDEWYPR